MPSEKLTSIVILGFNEIAYTKLCIDSIYKYTSRPFELVLVDNGSTDGTGDYFDSLQGAKVIKNKENLGFAKGCNQGMEASSGNYVLLLNNDIVATPNWLDNLIACAESDPVIGLVGPMSNYVAGPQQILVPYGESLDEMETFAQGFNIQDPSKYEETEVLIGFCMLIKKSVIEKIGLLDESFGLGNFEDNDYCIRARMAGFKLIRAGDTFIHHFGNRTFIGNAIDWRALMSKNSAIFNEKWSAKEPPVEGDLVKARSDLVDVRDSLNADPVKIYADRHMQKQWNVPDEFTGSPTLSLAMIVKDEEDHIGRCLESVKGVVDEIIVVDTGSTDRTVEIAKSYGAKIFFHAWTGDFSEARNVSLEHATGDWVMFLDADEELVKEDAGKLRELLIDTENEGFYFNEISFIGDSEEEGAVVNLAFRLWRNKPEYRFTGAIHEQVLAKIQSYNPNIGFSGIRINHYGYMNKPTQDKDKLERNLNILLKEVKERPDDSFVRFNLGVEYLRKQEYDKALEQYQKAFANLSSLSAAYASVLIRNISLCLKELGRFKEALKVLKDAKEAYHDYTDLIYLEGMIHMDANDYEAAIESLKTCLELGPSGMNHISQSGVGGHMAAFQLATCYNKIGHEKAAVDTFKKALELNPRDYISLKSLGLMLVYREEPGNLQQFLELLADITSENVLLVLSFIFNRGGYYDIAFDYLSRIDGSTNPSRVALARGECLLNLKRYSEAVTELSAVSESSQFYTVASIDRAICHVLLGDYNDAIKAVDIVKDNDDFNLIYHIYRSLINLLNGDLVSISIKKSDKEQAYRIAADILGKFLGLEAFEVFEKAINLLTYLDLSQGEVSLFLGKVYYDAGFSDMAVEELAKAYEMGNGDGEAFFILGRTAFENEFYEEARTFFTEALQSGIEEHTLFMSLARSLIKLGDIEEAIAVLDKGAKKYPDSPLITEIRQSLSALV